MCIRDSTKGRTGQAKSHTHRPHRVRGLGFAGVETKGGLVATLRNQVHLLAGGRVAQISKACQ
eukprot:6648490-Prorocentrum_lima.AAC.1